MPTKRKLPTPGPKRKPPNAGKGRVKGNPNKLTRSVREVLATFVEHNAAGAQALYDRVAKKDPKGALEIFAKMAEFVLPKLVRAEMNLPVRDDVAD